MNEDKKLNHDVKFEELCALANSGALTTGELAELKCHLQTCEECREIYNQYLFLVSEGIPALAADCSHNPTQGKWDDAPARDPLFARHHSAEELSSSEAAVELPLGVQPNLVWQISLNSRALFAVAACFVVAIGFGAYLLSIRSPVSVKQAQSPEVLIQKQAPEEEKSVDELVDAYKKTVSKLQQKESQMGQELAKLRATVQTEEDSASKLAAAKSETDEQLQTISLQRDDLEGQLRDAENAYLNAKEEIGTISSERDKSLQRDATLESGIQELSTANRDLERKVAMDEQYLASDRDIRELMGARKLYIADVFDVDSHSRTLKPFGRVFYTQDKSLLFYAFDLDRERALQNSNTFQAWGRRGMDQGEPLNLGIFYKDSESNRRWVLRFDDPKELADIDAVFVTIEPHGGSQKPTGKPFLYALLRKEANHP